LSFQEKQYPTILYLPTVNIDGIYITAQPLDFRTIKKNLNTAIIPYAQAKCGSVNRKPVTIDSVQAATIMGRILREHLIVPEP
jgi:hypothetical protein